MWPWYCGTQIEHGVYRVRQKWERHQRDWKCHKLSPQCSFFFFRPSYYRSLLVYAGAAQSFPCTRLLPHLPCPSGVLLCCQITKWLFACYKQRKQILYRYYIYIDMFYHWEMRIGIYIYIYIPLIRILKDNTHTERPTRLHTDTYIQQI